MSRRRIAGHRRLALALAAMLASSSLASAQAADDLAALSDEFDRPARLAEWRLHHQVEGWSDKLKRMEVGRAGHLVLEPWPSVWFYDYAAPFLFKEVEGDFVVTTRLRVSGTRTAYPQTLFSLAGLMARAPRTSVPFASDSTWAKDREDYVFLVTGTTREPGKPFIETKSAVRSKPLVEHFPITHTGWLELRLARVGSTFLLLFRPDGGEWTAHERIDRPDLGRRLQVGLMTYGDFGTIEERHWYRPWEYNTGLIRDGREDLRVEVDWVRYRRAAPSAAAMAFVRERGIRWGDYRVSNEQLVTLLPFLVEDVQGDASLARR